MQKLPDHFLMVWECIAHRVAAFAVIGHKRTAIPSVLFLNCMARKNVLQWS